MMFEIVTSPKQQQKFEQTWEYFCKLYNWKNDPYAKDGVRYNLLISPRKISNRKTIGTIEFIPYYPGNPESTVEGSGRYQFSELDEIKLNPGRIWEIDKLCIHQDYQNQGYLNVFMHIFYDHASKYRPKYYIALIEKKFYRALRISYGLSVEQIGDPFIGPNNSLLPVIFNIETMMQNHVEVRNKLKLIESTNNSRRTETNTFNSLLKKILEKTCF